MCTHNGQFGYEKAFDNLRCSTLNIFAIWDRVHYVRSTVVIVLVVSKIWASSLHHLKEPSVGFCMLGDGDNSLVKRSIQ